MPIQSSPKIRAIVYLAAVTLQLAAILSRAIDRSGTWGDAIQSCANFLGAVAGVTAVSNLTGPPSSGLPRDTTQRIPQVK